MADNIGAEAERLGRAVQVRRAELGLKRPELAKRAELSYPYVSEIENGMKMPSHKALGQLAQALELSLTELMGRAESLEVFGDEAQPALDPAFEDLHAQRRLFRGSGSPARSSADAFTLRAVSAPSRRSVNEAGSDRRLEELITTIVRAELAAWARSELPALVRAEVQRAIAEEDE
jgi:transcriptional regulator with XRE-family HTH domain